MSASLAVFTLKAVGAGLAESQAPLPREIRHDMAILSDVSLPEQRGNEAPRAHADGRRNRGDR